jgi:hypothetical protein
MPRKPKFKPVIRRVKLNPEQAVLQCDCYFGVRGTWIFSYRGVGSTTEACVLRRFTSSAFTEYELSGDGAYMILPAFTGGAIS